MPTRKPLHLVLGIMLLLLGTTISLIMIRGLVILLRSGHAVDDFWLTGSFLNYLALGPFCIWVASHEFRRASGEVVRKSKFRWGRLLAGVWFIFFALRAHLAPGRHFLKASDPAHAAGMTFATVVLVCIGLGLVAMAFQPRKLEVRPEASVPFVPGN